MKQTSPAKHRLVIYVTKPEFTKLRVIAKQSWLRSPSQLAGGWIRQRLEKTEA